MGRNVQRAWGETSKSLGRNVQLVWGELALGRNVLIPVEEKSNFCKLGVFQGRI